MESSSVKRRLACILAADAVGYSRMVGAHETETLRVLAAHRAVIDGIIAFHEGRIFSTAGDSVVAEFASAVDGVRCAVEIQSALRTRNESLPQDQRLPFRIGLNLGDVVVKGTDVLGDGVNVAARLESIAEPGGICISSSVYDQITGKLDLGLVDIGDQQLKNIERPIRAFRVHGASMPALLPAPATARRPWVWSGAIGALIAVAAIAWWMQGMREAPPDETKRAPAAAPPSDAQVKLAAEIEAAQFARREADLARQQAAAELSRAKAEAEASATRNKALSDAAAMRASAQADAEKLRAQARREAAARGAGTSPAPSAASTSSAAVAAGTASAPPSAPAAPASVAAPAAPAMASASSPAASSVIAATAGTERWTGTLACNAYDENPSFSRPLPAYRQGGAFVMDWGERGAPGSAHIEGRPEGSVLVMTGTAIAIAKRFRGNIVDVRFDGRLADGRYELKGSIGARNCTLALARP